MTWNLDFLACVLGVGAMLGLGAYHRRRGLHIWWFIGAGSAAIFAAYKSDRRVSTLIGIFIACFALCLVMTAIHMLVVIRRRRVPVYRPIAPYNPRSDGPRRTPRSSHPRRLAELEEWEAGE